MQLFSVTKARLDFIIMSKINKGVARPLSKPKDFTWNELKMVLAYFGYVEIRGKGFKETGFDMKNALKYKSYTGIVEFSAEDGVFFGKLFGINDLVTFEGASVKELEKAFREAADDYIETCEAMGKPAERNFKGSFNIRINPHVHRQAAFKAQSMRISLNEFVEQAISKAVQLPLVAEDSYTPYQKVSSSKKAAPKEKRKGPVKGSSKKNIRHKVKNQ